MYTICDHFQGIIAYIHIACPRHENFSIGKWYAEICVKQGEDHRPLVIHKWMQQHECHKTIMGTVWEQYTACLLKLACPFTLEDDDVDHMEKWFDVQIDCHNLMHLVIHDKFWHVVSQLP